jgi:predicted  nucleic acid-binding Zn-ribbon protein
MSLPLNTTRDDLDFSLKTVWKELEASRVRIEGLELKVEGLEAEIRALKKKGRGTKGRKQRTTAKGVESS